MENYRKDELIPMKKRLFTFGLKKKKKKKKKKNQRLKKFFGEGGEAAASKAESESESVVSVMSNDDLVLEILIRLPDFKTVIRLSGVCETWRSVSRQPHLVQKFISHHSQKQQVALASSSSSYVLLMRGESDNATSGHLPTFFYYRQPPTQNIFSNASKIIFPFLSTTSSFESFLKSFDWPNAQILTCFDDLLLVQLRRFCFCIVNPVTKQVVELPSCPKILYEEYTCYRTTYRCGFVASSSSSNSNLCKYKVVLITTPDSHYIRRQYFRASIFNSETREWSCCFKICQNAVDLYDWHMISIGCNGTIYWLFGE